MTLKWGFPRTSLSTFQLSLVLRFVVVARLWQMMDARIRPEENQVGLSAFYLSVVAAFDEELELDRAGWLANCPRAGKGGSRVSAL